MSKRTFFKTVITVEVLSEGPFQFESLEGVAYAIQEGDCSGQYWTEEQVELGRREFVAALEKQQSGPGFFFLDENGDDTDGVDGEEDEE